MMCQTGKNAHLAMSNCRGIELKYLPAMLGHLAGAGQLDKIIDRRRPWLAVCCRLRLGSRRGASRQTLSQET